MINYVEIKYTAVFKHVIDITLILKYLFFFNNVSADTIPN